MRKKKKKLLTAQEKKDIGIFILAFLGFATFGYTYAVGTGEVRPQPLAPVEQSFAVSVPFLQIAQGSQSTVTQRENYLITSNVELQKLWKMLSGAGKAPTIDFSNNAVLAVFAGQEPTAGYSIAVSKVQDALERTVVITLAKPSPDCTNAELITAPYQIVVVPTTSLSLTHVDTVTTANCKNW